MIVRPRQRARIAESVEMALSVGVGWLVVHVLSSQVAGHASPAPGGKAERSVDGEDLNFSQHFACDRCGRSFEPLSPHSFSFNSSLGWCPACEGLGLQLGANPAALFDDPKLTLAEGAVRFGRLWTAASSP